jgi:3D (Asp-Asp-Asp) domain-containing protein
MQIRSQQASPRRSRLARVVTPALAVVLAGGMIGVWACAPRAALAPAAVAPAPAAFMPELRAAPAPAPAEPSAEQIRAIEARVRAQVEAEMRSERARASNVAVRERIEMSSTAYCLKGLMRTGVRTRDGMAAGDPRVLPLGSVVRVSRTDGRPIGTFVIMDTGGAVRGNKIDIYMDSCREASDWGRKPVVVEVLSIGRS